MFSSPRPLAATPIKVVSFALLLVLLLVAGCSSSTAENSSPTTSNADPTDGSAVTPNPGLQPTELVSAIAIDLNPNSPLTGWLTTTLDGPATISGTLSAGDHFVEFEGERTPATSHRVPITGLRPDRSYRVSMAIHRGDTEALEYATFRTDPLPNDFPPVTAAGEASDDGWTLFTAENPPGFDAERSYIAAVDRSGEIVWYYTVTEGAPRSVHLTPDGNIRFLAEPLFGREITPMGDTVREWRTADADLPETDEYPVVSVAANGLYGSLIELSDGKLATIDVETISTSISPSPCQDGEVPLASRVDLIVDRIVVFDPDTGEIDFTWSATQHFSPSSEPGSRICDFRYRIFPRIPGAVEWSLAGDLTYDEDSGLLIMPSRLLDAVVAIQLEESLFGGPGEVAWELSQNGSISSNVSFTDPIMAEVNGTSLLLYDSGGPDSSGRALEFDLDLGTGSGRLGWQFRHAGANGSETTNAASGMVRRIDDARVLIVENQRDESAIDGSQLTIFGSFIEVDQQTDEILLEVTIGQDDLPWVVPTAIRIPWLGLTVQS